MPTWAWILVVVAAALFGAAAVWLVFSWLLSRLWSGD